MLKSKHPMYNFIINEGIPLLLVFFWVFMAVQKLTIHQQFYLDLFNSPLVSNRLTAKVLAWGIPLGLGGNALLLSFYRTRRLGLYIAAGLLLLFSAYIIYLLNFIPHLPCSCSGMLQALTWPQQLCINLSLLVLTLIALINKKNLQ